VEGKREVTRERKSEREDSEQDKKKKEYFCFSFAFLFLIFNIFSFLLSLFRLRLTAKAAAAESKAPNVASERWTAFWISNPNRRQMRLPHMKVRLMTSEFVISRNLIFLF
jgi:hypothetical protein